MLSIILEKSLRQTLQYKQELSEKCQKLGEKDILITLLPFQKEWTIIFSHGEIRCYQERNPKTPDLHISASPSAFLAMVLKNDSKNITIEGDMVLAQVLQQCFHYADIDWEKWLQDIVGESFSYPIIQLLRKSHEKISDHYQNKKIQIADYLQEELNCLPLPSEIQSFCHDIDELKLRCDRLEARLNQVTQT